jgi:predicted dehydrogenase
MIGIGVVGCGYWGPNLIRNFSKIPNCRVVGVCDFKQERLAHIKSLYPDVKTIMKYDDIVNDRSIDALCIATPIATHFTLAKAALRKNKHVFVEKPLAESLRKAGILTSLAQKQKRILMVGHTFLYHPAIEKIRRILQNKELGRIYYVSMERLNLGLFQKDLNVVWDLAPHDISILKYITNKKPIAISAFGMANVYKPIEDVAIVNIKLQGGILVTMRLSWLDPHKVRKVIIVGSKKMLVYDDISEQDKITIYDKGVSVPKYYDSFDDFKFSYKYGDITKPLVDNAEPLEIECRHFIDCIENNRVPKSDGAHGMRVIKIIESIQRSIKNNGRWEKCQW